MRLDRNGHYDIPPGKLVEVVTYLEMTARPAPRPVPARADLALRRVASADLDWYRGLFRQVGEPWLWASRLVLSDQELATILHDPLVDLYAVEKDGRAEGILELDRRFPPDIELAFFGVAPSLVGTGAGRWLMEQALDLAWRHAPRRFWVHTCSLDHPAALAFYQRSGFVPYRRAIEIGDDPRLTGHYPATAGAHIPLIA
ncbi:GNAT family N-acetyltransferase [Geminicoccaceae bacterium 1502E]|nr:GNAT family N-acetyltransferase [Geminicoccaceae bacterium 1502E]